MTASELQDLIVSTLLREHGGLRQRWRIVVGPIRLHDLATHAHCNWSLAPSGDYRENERVERLLDRMRPDHPIVTPG